MLSAERAGRDRRAGLTRPEFFFVGKGYGLGEKDAGLFFIKAKSDEIVEVPAPVVMSGHDCLEAVASFDIGILHAPEVVPAVIVLARRVGMPELQPRVGDRFTARRENAAK